MNELLLIVTIAGQRVALLAAEVQSVIEIGALTPVPRAPRHIAGLSALRSRVLTAIDCRHCIGRNDAAEASPARYAAVVDHDGHSYALLVEAVDDVTVALSQAETVRSRLGQGWASMTRGMVETAEAPLLLIDIGAMIAGPDEARVAA